MKSNAEQQYLNLLKKCLTRTIFDEKFDRIPRNTKTPWKRFRSFGYEAINKIFSLGNLVLVHSARPTGETMLDMERLDNIEFCIKSVLAENIPGDVIETGVWRGGASILMNAVLQVYGGGNRKVWVADSFQGLPKPNPEKYPDDKGDVFWKQTLGVSVEAVKANFDRYGLLTDNVFFLEGFFSDTMPNAPIGQLSVLRLDGDMYESTIVVLDHLYPKLAVGGYVIVDDYGCVPACKKATEDYRAKHGITEEVKIIDWTGVYWRKER